MHGKVCVVTGANSGVGKALATELARRGATVVMVARNEQSGRAARREVARTAKGAVSLELADLSLLREVRALAARLSRRFERIDVLMNNAGIYLHQRRSTDEGLEVSFAVNHLAPFVLTNLLRARLAAAGDARVVMTSSLAYRTAALDLDDLMMERRWRPLRQYANAKLGMVLCAREITRRFAADGISANAFHPGPVRSGMARDEPCWLGTAMRWLGPFLRTPEQGAKTGIFLATSNDVGRGGELFVDGKARELSRAALDAELARDLWQRSAELSAIES